MKRFYPDDSLFLDLVQENWIARGDWPAMWIDLPDRSMTKPSVALFRLPFAVSKQATVRIHVSADNRYRLFLDGQPVGRGPERGDVLHWRFESYELTLTPGDHILLAQTWWLADQSPFAQMSLRPGFILAAEDEWQEKLSTGIAPWEAAEFPGIDFTSPGACWGTGAKVSIDGSNFLWGWETGQVGNWRSVTKIIQGMSSKYKNEIPPYWLLTPATLPSMREDKTQTGAVRYLTEDAEPYPVSADKNQDAVDLKRWTGWLLGQGNVTVPAGKTYTAIIDLENYYCAYPNITVSGGKGAVVRVRWAEGLYKGAEAQSKGNRNEIEGKYFRGVGDVFQLDGGEHRTYTTLWWEAGRYIELMVTAADDSVTLEELTLSATGYPISMEGKFSASDERLGEVISPAVRSIQMCSHETYMDCPYYEQLMYAGDTRLEVLTTYVMTHDDRLPQKALQTFDESRRTPGFTQSRYPSKVTQFIPPFSLWWVCMVHDYWQWRDDPEFVRERLSGVRAVMEAYREALTDDGLLGVPLGWNFMDWVPGWISGIPPKAELEPSSILNFQFIMTLMKKAELEDFFGEAELALRDRKLAKSLCDQVMKRFWNAERGLIANDLAQKDFSEHAQCLAILSGLLDEEHIAQISKGLCNDPDLARTTIYFTHYLFEAYYRLGLPDKMFDRLSIWFDLKKLGFKTTLEMPEPTRSDCHAWAAHPLYHYYAFILGIHPQGAGFHNVRIAPQLGSLTWAEGVLPHPKGIISAKMRLDNTQLHAEITLPDEINGVFVWKGNEVKLHQGMNSISLSR